jgi:putrescine transport system substrate-binding protein
VRRSRSILGSMSRNLIAVSSLLLMCACGGSEHRAPTVAAPDSSYDREKVLNVYSWADYIAPDTVPNFEKQTGIKVRYDTYDNNELLETKLLTGHTNYDIVIPTENFFDRQMRAGVYRKLDKGALTNLANADPEIMRRLAVHDPGNLYAVPYMWTSTGLAYNVNRVKERLGSAVNDSWALLFDPANAGKLQDCGIAIIDSPLEIFQSAMIYLGRDPNRHDPADIAAASELLRKIRPFVGRIEPDLIAPVASGDVCLALAWSGDMGIARNRAIEASRGVQVAYFVPREGALLTVDMMAIPADAPHPRNAEAWMNYLLRPEVIAAISNYIKYPNGNRASLPYLDASIKADPGIYPDAATRARLLTNSAVSLDYSRLVTREWTRFRTAE